MPSSFGNGSQCSSENDLAVAGPKRSGASTGDEGARAQWRAGGPLAGEAGPLGTSLTVFPDAAARERRRVRFVRRQQSSEWLIRQARLDRDLPPVSEDRAGEPGWVRPPRAARCRWRAAAVVGVHGDEKGAHYSGLERCASIWACPVCAAVIRAERAREIQAAVDAWQRTGGSVVFVTLTVRHRKGDTLAATLEAVMAAWRGLLQGRVWGDFRARFGIRGYVRAVEITFGASGWHPHIHGLFFVDAPLKAGGAAVWESLMFSRWAALVVKHGGRLPTKLRGIDVRLADTAGSVVGQYLAKVQEAGEGKRYGVGQEMARFDFKTGRGSSLMPFELLNPAVGEDAADTEVARRLWCEYHAATKGRRAITWSRGLRDLVNLDVEETDDEVIEQAERRELRFLVPAAEYDASLRRDPAVLALVLEAVEDEAISRALILSGGHTVGAVAPVPVPKGVDPTNGDFTESVMTQPAMPVTPVKVGPDRAAILRERFARQAQEREDEAQRVAAFVVMPLVSP